MIKNIIKELEGAGFRVDNHSGEMNGEPMYVVDLYGHKKQKTQIRIVDQNYYTFRETINNVIRRIKSARGKISL